MNKSYFVNPALSFGWQVAGSSRSMNFTARDPLSNKAAVLGPDEFWIPAWLNSIVGKKLTWGEMAASATAFASLPTSIAEATLARLIEVLFVEQNRGAAINQGLETWEQFDCKLAFEFLAQSLDDCERGRGVDPVVFAKGPANSEALVPLPVPCGSPRAPLQSVLYGRRTCREFNGSPIELTVFSSLLYWGLARLPKPVALSAVVYHVIVLRACGLRTGAYVYDPTSHSTNIIRECCVEELESDLVRMLIGQTYAKGSACAVLLSVDTRALFAEDPRPSTLRRWIVGAGIIAQRLIVFGATHGLRTFLSAAIAEHHTRPITGCVPGGWHVPMHCLVFGYSERNGRADSADSA